MRTNHNHVPQQPQQPPRLSVQPPVAAPRVSEASRLLCAGTYLDDKYRDQVIDELYLSEHRVVAPSFGFDAARVLAHALRARRVETAWALAVTLLMAIGAVATDGWLLVLVLPGLLMTLGKHVRGTADDPQGRRRLPSFTLRWVGRILLAYLVYSSVVTALGAQGPPDAESETGEPSIVDLSAVQEFLSPGTGQVKAWTGLLVLLALGACVAGQEMHFVRVLRGELSPRGFASAADDPAEQARGRRFQGVQQRIRLEQHSPLVMYHEARPFCGAGTAHDPWVLAVELRPDGTRQRQPLGNGAVLAAVRPFIEQLREMAESAEVDGHAVRDRLRQLEIDECVFLPVEGLQRREEAPYDHASFEAHRARATEEGGEKRRHFLRIRVGGWEHGLVVTVFVRIHTQGRMLMLEIAPHALLPVRADFKDADHIVYRFADMNAFGKAIHILTLVAGAPGQALTTLGRHVVRGWRRLTGEADNTQADGPALSVRELAAEPDGSLFQTMDVDRYLKSVQDRIAYGVKTTLAEAGYQTDEFTQKIIHVSNGGVNIDSVAGSTFAVGAHAHATTSGAQSSPQRGVNNGQ